jgi:actin-related protein
VEDLDFFIGDEALAAAKGHGYGIHYPVRHGLIENWDLMEKYWQQCIFKYLRAEPEDHCFLLVSRRAERESSGSCRAQSSGVPTHRGLIGHFGDAGGARWAMY